jgi:hypothetical protein
MNKTIIAISASIAVIFLSQCKKASIDQFDCTGISPTYTADVKSILDTRCATSGCHSAGSKSGGIDLSSYLNASAESKKDRFLGSIQHKSGYNAMPQGSAKLDDATIKTLSCWVQNGSPQ